MLHSARLSAVEAKKISQRETICYWRQSLIWCGRGAERFVQEASKLFLKHIPTNGVTRCTLLTLRIHAYASEKPINIKSDFVGNNLLSTKLDRVVCDCVGKCALRGQVYVVNFHRAMQTDFPTQV